jgi:hypothetical protein
MVRDIGQHRLTIMYGPTYHLLPLDHHVLTTKGRCGIATGAGNGGHSASEDLQAECQPSTCHPKWAETGKVFTEHLSGARFPNNIVLRESRLSDTGFSGRVARLAPDLIGPQRVDRVLYPPRKAAQHRKLPPSTASAEVSAIVSGTWGRLGRQSHHTFVPVVS